MRKNTENLTKKNSFAGLSKMLIAIMLAITTVSTGLIGCGKKGNESDDSTGGGQLPPAHYYDNEEDPLIFSTLALDKVFSPFYSTSATDSSVVGMTQIGMIGNDKDGNPVYGDDEPVVTQDLEIKDNGGILDKGLQTTYKFVLKNNVKFSNGSPLTMKDVLFNLYVYLDPVYSGSSTIYSTEIVGLKQYRTQVADSDGEDAQSGANVKFEVAAQTRIDSLAEAAFNIFDENQDIYTEEDFLVKLEEVNNSGTGYENVVKDYKKATEFFRKELKKDFSNAKDSYDTIIFKDKDKNIYKNLFTTDVEAFLYNENYITWNKNEAKLESSLTGENDVASLKNLSEEDAIELVYADMVPAKIDEIVTAWGTSTELKTYITNELMEEYYQGEGSDRKFKNISGIQFANMDGPVTVNGKEYKKPEYNADGSVKEGFNEVLSITIKNIDPKAIWNFSFGIAPLYYYSTHNFNGKDYIKSFDYKANFGIEYASQTFVDEVLKGGNRIDVPVGAGMYAASKSSGGIEDIQPGQFYDLGAIYFERNPYFVLGPAKIKKVRYKVVSSAQMLNELYGKQIDFAEPNAKVETIKELDEKKKEGIENTSIRTAGYGYIGINAGKVPNIKVRQAIMHSISTKEIADYYLGTADQIFRPMSKSSWAYPQGCTAYYPYIGDPVPENLDLVNPDYADYVIGLGKQNGDILTDKEQKDFIRSLLSGYEENGEGVLANGSDVLKYTFTIAGEESDHPAFDAFLHAKEILNDVGFAITVRPDPNALKKLSNGDLSVWAAAWGSTIDPDMYQVYHIDSKATSTLNWGYKQIKQDPTKYSIEYDIIAGENRANGKPCLSDLIDQARKIDSSSEAGKVKRAEIYKQALDLVMELAVELPTYQRDDLFAYNGLKLDGNSLTPESERTPFNGLTSKMWQVSLVVKEK